MKTRLINIAILFFMTVSCSNFRTEYKTVTKYIGNSGYQPGSIPDLRNDTIVLAFTGYFKKDVIEIKIDSFSKKIDLNTNPVLNLSEIIDLGRMKKGNEITLKFNNKLPLKIKPDSSNQIFIISYYPDTLFLVESVFHLPHFK